MNESETCLKCSKPKVQNTHGSITQWMSSCGCDLLDSTALAACAVATTILCKVCGKRIDPGRAGSLTQWIFRSDKCECEVPQPAEFDVTPLSSEPEGAESGIDESGLELEPSVFPTDRYKATREIGKGAAGQVFLCKDKLLKTKVAVKCLRHLSSEQLISFQQEARATSMLSHPSIVKILNFGITDGGAPYMVMNFIDGISLETYLQRSGPLKAADAVSIVAQTADALAYAHSRGVLHRDIKSSNILIEGNRACLIDFGIAMVKQAHPEPAVVQGRTVVGTPSYMPPDQANGLTYDERSEIYSLGCVLFEALAGEPPFGGDTALEIINKHATQIAPKVSEVNPDADCTDEIESILARCLAKLPDNRFKTMSELRDACDSTGTANEESGCAEDNAGELRQNDILSDSMFEPKKRATDKRVVIAVIATGVGLTIASAWFIMSHQTQVQSQPVHLTPVESDLVLPINDGTSVRAMIKRGEKEIRLGMVWPDCTDDDLAVFDGNKVVKVIDCTEVKIGDAALKHFSSLPLERLYLGRTNIKTLDNVPASKTLKALSVNGTGVNDDALLRLSKFEKLETISLRGTNVTADGIIRALSKVPLHAMELQSCPDISKVDVEKIRMAFPVTRISNHRSVIEEAEVADSIVDPRSSFEKWKKWRDYSKTHPDPSKRLAVSSLCNLAKQALRMDKMSLAKSYLDEALMISAQGGFPFNLRQVQESLFDYYVHKNEPDSAIEVGMRALNFDERDREVFQLELAYKVAGLLISKNRCQEALELLERTETASNARIADSEEIAGIDAYAKRDLKNARLEQISLQLRLAHCLLALHRGEESIVKSNNALSVVRANAITDPVVIAEVFIMKANGEAECKKFSDALESNEQAIKASENSKTSRGKEQHAEALKQRQAILRAQK